MEPLEHEESDDEDPRQRPRPLRPLVRQQSEFEPKYERQPVRERDEERVCEDDHGPTKVICPRKMLQSCGSSSILVRRRILPIFVIRGSSFPAWTSTWMAFCTIDLNFRTRKSRP